MPKIVKRMASNRQGVEPGKAYALGEAVKLVKARANAKFDETDRSRHESRRRSPSRRPDGARRVQPAQRFGTQAQGGGVRQGCQGGGGQEGGRRHRRCRGSGRDRQQGHDRLRSLHRHARHDAAGRPAGQGSGPARPHAQPQGRHGDHGCDRCREGGEGRCGRVSGREGGDRSGRCRQGEFHRGAADRQHQGVRRCGGQAEAAGPEGHVREEGVDVLELWAPA